MKVFISHTFTDDDQKLALKLQKILSKENIDGYLAEKKKEYDLLIRDKIRKEIEHSDHMIAIVTNKARESASVNQEIGFALREGINPIMMLEKNAKSGVLTQGLELEEFTRDNFEMHCKNVLKFIQNKGTRKKISSEEKKILIDNVYRACYNQIKNDYDKKQHIQEIPPNPWNNVEHYWKLKTESDIKELFDEYSIELKKWEKIFVQRENDFFNQQRKLGEIITPAFEQARLITKYGNIELDEKHSIEPQKWLHAFRLVIFNPQITNASILHQQLSDFAKLTRNGHEQWLDQFSAKTDLFRHMVKLLPYLRDEFNTKISDEELEVQREKIRVLIEKLKLALEEKLK